MNIRVLGLLFGVLMMGLTACKKNNDAPVVSTSIDSLNVVNATADTINYYLNGTRLNNNSNLYPSGSSGYYQVPGGSQAFQVKKIFNPATGAAQSLFNITLPLEPHHYYSLFVAGESSDQAFTTLDTLRADTITNQCYVRFVNASPDAGSYDFAVGDTLKFTSKAFKSAGGFTSVGVSGFKPLALYQSGSSTPLISVTYPLIARLSYTFYTRGKLNGTGNSALGLSVTVNFN
ncbi:MAG: DUF4397 domain-containing protein [Sphingobacteriales bacterium]